MRGRVRLGDKLNVMRVAGALSECTELCRSWWNVLGVMDLWVKRCLPQYLS